MGLFDWIGPLNAGGRRRPVVAPVRKMYTIDDQRAAFRSTMLVHGPGATDLLRGWRGNDANSAVYACLDKLSTAIAEPELEVFSTAGGERVELDDTALAALLARPNPHMTLDQLLSYLVWCLKVDGNGYWRKLRSGNDVTGNVVELWPISPTRVELHRTNPTDFISFYRYWKSQTAYDDIPPENMVHFRQGLDDADHRLGCSGLKRLVREVSSDDQATRYADRLLANFATPGLSVEFPDAAEPMTQDEIEEVKSRLQAAYGGDNVGAVSVMSPGAKLVTHGFSPEQMQIGSLHRVPEERIAAVIGVPAIVAGLGAGLDRSTYANFKEAREAFTEMTLIPMWKSIAATITLQLVPDFGGDSGVIVDFDLGDVRALADDENAQAVKLKTLVEAGILDADEARAEIGREPRVPAPAPAGGSGSGTTAGGTRSRPPISIVRPTREVKAASDMAAGLDHLKFIAEPDWESDVIAFLTSQQRRVIARLHAGHDTAEGLVVEGEAQLLGEKLTPLQLDFLGEVVKLTAAELAVEFTVDDPATRSYLASAGTHVVGITDTTRSAVRAALVEGQSLGEGVDQLARRLRFLPEFDAARGRVVARTELGHAANTAAVTSYRSSGVVVGIRVHDGDYDPACAAMNGRVFRLGDEPATLQHPNCRRAFAPIVDAGELDQSA